MSTEAIEVFSQSLRLLWITGTNMGMSIFIVYTLLEKRRSLWALVLYAAGKVLFHTVLVSYVLKHYFGEAYWLQILTLFSVLVFAVLTYVMNCYTFKGGLLKIAIAALVGEITAVFLGYFSIAFINLLEEKKDVWNLIDRFQRLDLLIPIVAGALLCFFYHFTVSFLHRFRGYELRHKKILWVLFLCHVSIGNLTMLLTYDSIVVAGTLAGIISCMIAAGSGYLIVKYYRKLQYIQRFQKTQKRIIEAHYETVQGQIHAMEKNRKQIDTQMAEIVKMGMYSSGRERIALYLDNLKQSYEGIQAGVYCDDWKIDAVIYSQALILKKAGIEFECSMPEGKIGEIREEDYIQILLLLLNMGAKLNEELVIPKKKVQLHVAMVKNQLVMDFSSTCNDKCRITKREFKVYLRKYQGEMRVNKNVNTVEIRLSLQK